MEQVVGLLTLHVSLPSEALCIEAMGSELVKSLKVKIAAAAKCKEETFTLVYEGETLDENKRVDEYPMMDGCTVQVVVILALQKMGEWGFSCVGQPEKVLKELNGDYTVLATAARLNELDVVQHLVEKMKVLEVCGEDEGRAALVEAAEENALSVVQYLVEEAGVVEKDWGDTALTAASQHNALDVVKYLIEKDPSKTDAALRVASENNVLNIVRYLCETGRVDPAQTDRLGKTPLHLAARKDAVDVIRYLVEEQGFDPTARHYHGNSALHEALMFQRLNVVRYLVEEAGVELTPNGNRDTPYKIAATFAPDGKVACYLRDRGITE